MLLIGCLALVAPDVRAADAVVRIEERQFRAGAGRISFSEVSLRTVNPVYPPSLYGGGAGSPTVRFGGHFRGRRLGGGGECPRGAAASGCLAGTPTAPLAIDPSSPEVRTLNTNSPGSDPPKLGGTPTWNGPIAIWFDRDVAAVGLQGGYFDAARGVAITVYDRQGKVLGRTVNTRIGHEFMALATTDLSARIAGLEFHLVGPEPAGYGVDNIRFGAPPQIDLPGRSPPPAPPAAPPAPPPKPAVIPPAPPPFSPIPP